MFFFLRTIQNASLNPVSRMQKFLKLNLVIPLGLIIDSNLLMKRTELLAGLSIRFSEKFYFYVSYYLQENAPVK